jgi:hypothetical protein
LSSSSVIGGNSFLGGTLSIFSRWYIMRSVGPSPSSSEYYPYDSDF